MTDWVVNSEKTGGFNILIFFSYFAVNFTFSLCDILAAFSCLRQTDGGTVVNDIICIH